GRHSLLDRWILSRFHSTTAAVTQYLDVYELTRAARRLQSFVLDELSNWYVRRSRRRFWKGEMGPDKTSAYYTLYTVLDGVARLLAPFTPFVAEELYLSLRGIGSESESDRSVHLELFPRADTSAIDDLLEKQVDVAMTVASLGRNIRNEAGIRVRQPLSELILYSDDESMASFLDEKEVVASVLEELNVRAVGVADSVSEYVELKAKPNFPVLGKRFAKRVPEVAAAVGRLDTEALLSFNRSGEVAVEVSDGPVTLTREELTVETTGKVGFGVNADRGITAILNLDISHDLRLEGLAREAVNRLQNLRKKAGLEITDRIRIVYADNETTTEVFSKQGELVRGETLAVDISPGAPDWEHEVAFKIDETDFHLWLRKAD
ncbi:MAG: class I tRNA ligase family protein, partial [Candidatus Krumholzibacteria bacterium]|nr:class I tRNA ligase family protein [Candidatus Krumholzibacteria bacterium]